MRRRCHRRDGGSVVPTSEETPGNDRDAQRSTTAVACEHAVHPLRIGRIGADHIEVVVRPVLGPEELLALVDRFERLIDAGYDTIDVVVEPVRRHPAAAASELVRACSTVAIDDDRTTETDDKRRHRRELDGTAISIHHHRQRSENMGHTIIEDDDRTAAPHCVGDRWSATTGSAS